MAVKYLTASALVTAVGAGRDNTVEALRNQRGGLKPVDEAGLTLYAGHVEGLEGVELAAEHAAYDCRNNRLAEMTLRTDDFAQRLEAAVAHYGPGRIGVFLATSTGGMRETEAACRALPAGQPLPETFTLATTHRLSATADSLRTRCGLRGPVQSISTACSSSAKALASAARHIDAGLCDAALVGGVDTLCRTTLYGFNALELTSQGLCRPFDPERDGLCLGEAGALALLEPRQQTPDDTALLGYGESTDAHHLSTPHPEGAGARLAIRRALASAGLGSGAIDYINLHGTATPLNDRMEDQALVAELGDHIPASSTKGWTGHTLGAAGMVEALISALCLEEGLIPGTLNTRKPDPELRTKLQVEPAHHPLRRVMSQSFGFGGNNCSLILGYP